MKKLRNIANLNLSNIETEIEIILFGGDKGLPMDVYLRMKPITAELAELVVTHADAVLRKGLQDLRLSLATEIRDKVGSIVLDHINDLEGIEYGTKPEEESKSAMDELLELDI